MIFAACSNDFSRFPALAQRRKSLLQTPSPPTLTLRSTPEGRFQTLSSHTAPSGPVPSGRLVLWSLDAGLEELGANGLRNDPPQTIHEWDTAGGTGPTVCVGMHGGRVASVLFLTQMSWRNLGCSFLTHMSLRVIPRRQRPSFGKKLYLFRHIYCGIFAT
jgi:hypothetical protein